MTAILGLSAFYHDSAAAFVVDGKIIAAAEEERFTRIKHDASFPMHAMRYCLREAGVQPDYIAFYDKPIAKFDRLLETYIAYAPSGFRSFSRAMPLWLGKKLHIPRMIRRALNGSKAPIVFMDHHESHAASAFFASPFQDAAIMTLDGVGEWSTATLGVGRGNSIALTHQLSFPHSLGLLYSAFTYYCGFKVNSGEYKLMGLAPYGTPRYVDAIYEHVLDLKEDGSFRLDMRWFNYCQGLTMTSQAFHDLFGGPPRDPEAPLLQRHMDLAASIQLVTEEIMLRAGRELHRQTSMDNLVLAGGVALNCVANARLLREGPFRSIWIQPAAGDSGGALGAALFVWHQLLDNPRDPQSCDAQRGSFLGPSFTPEEIRDSLSRFGASAEEIDEEMLFHRVANELDAGRIVGWFHGRMEFGPRALGARSILADARSEEMQSKLNLKIKFRESFRPFAPAVLREASDEWFELPRLNESPYMLLVAPVAVHQLLSPSAEEQAIMRHDPDLRRRLAVPRSKIPAVTHIDGSARVQTVDKERNPRFHKLLRAFYERTGCPVLVNTSFNVRGEPIVCTPDDAIRCFLATDIDLLVLENFILDKRSTAAAGREAHLARFLPD